MSKSHFHTLGCVYALEKLGKTVVMPALDPQAKAFMSRMTEEGAAAPMFGNLSQSQMRLRNLMEKVPLVGSHGEYYADSAEEAAQQARARKKLLNRELGRMGNVHTLTPEARQTLNMPSPIETAATQAKTMASTPASINARRLVPDQNAFARLKTVLRPASKILQRMA